MHEWSPSGIRILRSTYSYVAYLRVYICAILQCDDFVQPFGVASLDDLLDTSLVTADASPQIGLFLPRKPFSSQAEIIDLARSRLFTSNKEQFSNVINLGYRMADRRGEAHRSGLSNFFTNTTADILQTQDWQVLLEKIGEDAMLHILTTTSIFISLPNDCWCQVVGRPMYELIVRGLPIPAASTTDSRLKSRQERREGSVALSGGSGCAKRRSASEIQLIRARIFYSKPSRARDGKIRPGFPRIHVLNDLRKDSASANAARHILKYIFPSQYGFHNVFTSERDATNSAFPFRDYTDRNDEILARGKVKTPVRLKMILEIGTKLLQLHCKMDYRRLCNVVCPSKVTNNAADLTDASVVLDIMSEISELRTQEQIDSVEVSHLSSIFPHGAATALAAVAAKPRFTEFSCSHNEVYHFVAAVTRAVIPRAFWGSDRNLRCILRKLGVLVRGRRFETTNLHAIMQGICILDLEWLFPSTKSAQNQRICPTEFIKRRELLEEFLYWFFDSFIFSLLKTTFYITDSSAFRNRVLYFRQDDWDTVSRPLLDRLKSCNFVSLAKEDLTRMMRTRRLGFSAIRLLPKETGVRPIVNLRRRAANLDLSKGARRRIVPGHSINQILQAAFQILTLEKNRNPHLLGASVLGLNEIYEKLKAFKLQMSQTDGRRPPLYFVKVDVRACFDTIEQAKLLSILEQLVIEDGYLIQKYAQVIPTAGRMKRSFMKKACPDSEHPTFLSVATQLATSLRHAIFVDQVVYPYEDPEDLRELLREHVTENIVKIGDTFHRQSVGIPQGSVLSTVLCSFFYGDLERSKLAFTKDSQSLLLRFVDDFLFITPEKCRATQFLDVMAAGHPEYGCFITKDKTCINFDYHDGLAPFAVRVLTDPEFQWCGLTINTKTLCVKADYARYHDSHISDTLSIDSTTRAGAAFRHKLFQAVKQRSHIIFNDTSLNTLHIVYLNVYQNFLISAMKAHAYVRGWHADLAKHHIYITQTIREAVNFGYFALINKARGKLAVDNKATCFLRRSFVVWLGLHAFHHVLSMRAETYQLILPSLAKAMADARFARGRRRLAGIVKKGLLVMNAVSF